MTWLEVLAGVSAPLATILWLDLVQTRRLAARRWEDGYHTGWDDATAYAAKGARPTGPELRIDAPKITNSYQGEDS